MNMWLCSLTTSFKTLSGLVLLLRCSVLLVGFLCVYLIVSVDPTFRRYTSGTSRWISSRFASMSRWSRILTRNRQTQQNQKSNQGKTTAVPVTRLGILFALALGAVYAVTRPPKWPVEVHHNLRIEKQVSDRQWWIVDDEDPDGFMYYACADFSNSDFIVAGYLAREAKWQVKGNCNSIRDSGLGFWYVWNSGIARRIQ